MGIPRIIGAEAVIADTTVDLLSGPAL